VTLGSSSLTPLFAGLTPETVGIYQVNVALPQPLAQSGNLPLAITVAGQSTSILIPVQ